MKVRELLSMIDMKKDLDKEILISSDEEMNCLFSKGEIVRIDGKPNTLVIIGYSGTEVDL